MRDDRDQPSVYALLAILAVFAVALWIRLAGVPWDEFAGLHPDERFLLFTSFEMMRGLAEALARDASLSELWFATGTSPLDPRIGDRWYVYGEAPTIAFALVQHTFGVDDWFEAMQLGRTISSAVDAFTVIATAILAYELWRRTLAALLAATLYAAAPLALQLANFFTVDVFLVAAFAWCGVLLALLTRAHSAAGKATAAIATGVCIGLAVACKLPGVALGVPALVALGLERRRSGPRATVALGGAMALAAAVAFRLLNPFAFAGPGFWGLAPAQSFIDDLAAIVGHKLSIGFPPDWQWLAGYSPLAMVRDFVLFGAGPVLVVALLLGVPAGLARRPGPAVLALALALPVLGIAATAESPILRYAAPALPALAALAGRAGPAIGPAAGTLTMLAAAIWGSGVIALHTGEHPRLAASRWLWTLPPGTALANETAWDEGLPVIVALPGAPDRVWPDHDNHFRLEMLAITDPDEPAKAGRLAEILDRTDYLVISSGRQRAVMPRLSQQFPMAAAYYRMLESGELCFASVWRAEPGYPLPLMRFDDSAVQESWRVYDHPVVEIFRRQPCYDRQAVEEALMGALAGNR